MDKTLSQDQWKALFAQTLRATGYTVEQIRKNAGLTERIQAPSEDSFKLKADELESIKALNSKGFTVIDINPAALTRENSFCVYSPDVIQNIIGDDLALDRSILPFTQLYYDSTPIGVDGQFPLSLSYWRSIYISLPGNFLKVEYLQSRINFRYNEDPVDTQTRVPNYSEPIGTTEQNVYVPSTYNVANKLSADKTMLLDFTQNSSSPLVVKHEDTFETYFSGFFFTFKQNSPRIRITIGANSKIISKQERPTSLSMWHGHGLTNNQTPNPIPFSISDRDFTGVSTAGVDMSALNSTELCLIANPTPLINQDAEGLALSFITNISAYSYYTTGSTEQKFEVELFIKNLGTVGSGYITGSVKLIRLSSFIVESSQSSINKTFSDPLRVTLRKDTGLFMRITPLLAIGSTRYVKFSVEGYNLGPLRKFQNVGGFPQGPWLPRFKLQENPFPIDLDNLDSPSA